jgi:hypothetical protein
MLAHQELELGNQICMPAECEVDLDSLLERSQPELLEPPPLELHERVELDVRERGAAPERQCLA